MAFRLIDIINSISCFQLAIFVFILLFKGRKSLSNRILAFFFIIQFIVIFYSLVISAFSQNQKIVLQLLFMEFPFGFLWAPLMYFYVKTQLNSNFHFSRKDLLHAAPFFIVFILLWFNYYTFDLETRKVIIDNQRLFNLMRFINIPYYLLLFTYNFSALSLLNRYQKNLKNYFSFEIKRNLIWLKFVLYGYIIACFIVFSVAVAREYFPILWEVQLYFLYTPFLVFFNILYYKAMIDPYIILPLEEKPRYITSNFNENEIFKHANKIDEFIKIEKPFLNPNLTLKDLSENLNLSERIISQVINQYKNQNFFSYINSFRVEEAKKLLDMFDKSKDTMQGIAIDAGFNSRSAFYEAFKKYTGLTPTEYRKKSA